MPQRIGKYQIRSVLGEGAIGIVYEGFDPDIQRRVAIKILHDHLIKGKVGQDLLTRFKREAISAAKCIHPNIVTILEYGEDGRRPYIVMEYIDGVSVQRLIKYRRSISMKRSLSIISQLLRALHMAHKRNIIHRDVKASNVLISKENGRVKLADFGMARLAEGSDLTVVGHFVGTPRYMAPELRLGYEADLRADIFSAARLFLELLRLLPESSRIPCSRLPEIEHMPPGNRIDYSSFYPTALLPVLIKGLAVKREQRYQTVKEFMRAIKSALIDLRESAGLHPKQAAAIASESLPDFPVSDDELDSMTTLLADFMGPIAKIIMEEHETKSTSALNLATELAKEIPEPEMQEEFLQRWEMMSASRRAAIERKEPTINPETANRTDLSEEEDEVVNRMGSDFAHYVGPIAEPLLRHYSARSKSIDQLVKHLSREIPDREESRKFVKFWTRGRR